MRPEAILADLRAALERDGPAGLRAACRVALARHASTRERLPDLEAFYPAIFAHTGAPRSILDLACGLGPLAWPWMGLPPSIQYFAYDVDQRLVQLVDGFLTLLDVPHVVQLRDVVARPPREPVDVALLLKGAPCLDQQARGASRRLLEALPCAPRGPLLPQPLPRRGGQGDGRPLPRPPGTGCWPAPAGRWSRYPLALRPSTSSPAPDAQRPGRPRSLPTRHGRLPLPAFLPDATRAGVRAVDPEDLRAVGVPGIVVNTFHLMRGPGTRLIKEAGGVHRFMGWDGPVVSNSGGFQVYSLIRQNPGSGTIRPNEVIFREPSSGEKLTLTPERCVQAQFQLGSDVVMCLDDCTSAEDDPAEQARSVERTVRWAKRCRAEFDLLLSRRRPSRSRPPTSELVRPDSGLVPSDFGLRTWIKPRGPCCSPSSRVGLRRRYAGSAPPPWRRSGSTAMATGAGRSPLMAPC